MCETAHELNTHSRATARRGRHELNAHTLVRHRGAARGSKARCRDIHRACKCLPFCQGNDGPCLVPGLEFCFCFFVHVLLREGGGAWRTFPGRQKEFSKNAEFMFLGTLTHYSKGVGPNAAFRPYVVTPNGCR